MNRQPEMMPKPNPDLIHPDGIFCGVLECLREGWR